MWPRSMAIGGLGAAALAAALSASPQATGGELLMRALDGELKRSMAELRVEGLARPYFIAYRVDDLQILSTSASFGSTLSSRESHSRRLAVEVRVGDYQLDNTNFLALGGLRRGGNRSSGRVTLTLDDDYQEIRRQLWLATDAAYKRALEQLAQKRAVLQNKTLAEDLDDFSAVEPVEIETEKAVPGGELERLSSLARELSALFRRQSAVFESKVTITVRDVRSYFVNSEGTRFRKSVPSARLLAEASTQAADGVPLADAFVAVGDSVDSLPSRELLAREVSGLGERLAALRDAELLDRYNGPVLFEEQAAAELFAQAFAPRLLSHRDPLVGDERLSSLISQRGPSDFKDRLGARVLPRFLSLKDDATLAEFQDTRLLGGYLVDDQGVVPRPVSLVERGYLKRMLAGRTPITGVEASTGHWRGDGVAPSNLIVSSSTVLDDDQLRAELLLLVEDRGAEFGLIVRRLGSSGARRTPRDPLAAILGAGGGGESSGVAPAVVAVKVYPDGTEVAVRNLEFSGFGAATFKEIIAVGERPTVYSLPFSPVGDIVTSLLSSATTAPPAGKPLSTIVVPALLFEEVTLKKPTDEIPRLPVAGHPYFESRPKH